jgi:hypothetical protein
MTTALRGQPGRIELVQGLMSVTNIEIEEKQAILLWIAEKPD